MTVESLSWTSPLPDRVVQGLDGLPGTVRIVPAPFVSMAGLRVDPAGPAAADVAHLLGVDLPTAPSWAETMTGQVIWLGPDEWLVTSAAQAPQQLEAGLRGAVRGRGAVVDVSAQRTTLRLTGANARDVLSGGCTIDLHPRAFRRGAAAQTRLGLAAVVLLALDDAGTGFDVLVRASFAGYLVSWLLDAAIEHSDG